MRAWLLILAFMICAEAKTLEFSLSGEKHAPVYAATNGSKLGPLMDVFGSQVRSGIYNMRYYAEISLGTPSQKFSVAVDTGSRTLWVPKIGCTEHGTKTENLCKKTAELYNPVKSSTSKKLGPFQVGYGFSAGVSTTSGSYYTDVFAFGDGKSKDMRLKKPVVFGVADHIHDVERGILGMGLTRDGDATLIHEQAYEEGLLDKPYFSIYLKKCTNQQTQCQDGGVVKIGDEDLSNCEPVRDWVPVYLNEAHWQFPVDELNVGSYRIKKNNVIAITDSGAPMLYFPPEIVNSIVKQIGAYKKDYWYQLPCSKRFSISLKIYGKTYTMYNDALTFNMGKNRCLLMIAEGAEWGWLLGDPWVRSFCQIHNFQTRRVGFAKPRRL